MSIQVLPKSFCAQMQTYATDCKEIFNLFAVWIRKLKLWSHVSELSALGWDNHLSWKGDAWLYVPTDDNVGYWLAVLSKQLPEV